jgi:hypothetical protein
MATGPEFEIKVGSTEEFGYVGIKPVPDSELVSKVVEEIDQIASPTQALYKGENAERYLEIGYVKLDPDLVQDIGLVALKALYNNGMHTANFDCTTVDLCDQPNLFD